MRGVWSDWVNAWGRLEPAARRRENAGCGRVGAGSGTGDMTNVKVIESRVWEAGWTARMAVDT